MTDYSELIARVRTPYALTEHDAQEIADALEARGKRIDELESRLVDKEVRISELEVAFREAIKEVSRCSRECWKYEARIAELEAASKAYVDATKPAPR